MRSLRLLPITLWAPILSLVLFVSLSAETFGNSSPMYWEAAQLDLSKRAVGKPSSPLQETFAHLRKNANQALQAGPYSVMQKREVPPSGDKHDYMSFSRYWWPNPDTPDGLPYIRHDGKTNPDMRSRGDRDPIGELTMAVESLALAYYFFEEEKYAQHASLLTRTWFLDPETKMHPHLRFGQAVPGRSEGRGVGIIDTRGFIYLLDAVALLEDSPSWTSADQQQLKAWFTKYLDWLRTSKLGQEEGSAKNNHGSWHAAQVAHYALFVGAKDIAREIVEKVQGERIPRQFDSRGGQPFEAERTRSLHYSCFNLSALSVVARVGEHVGVDIWRAQSDNSGGLERGLRYLKPFLSDQDAWPHPRMGTYKLSPRTNGLLRLASVRYDDPSYTKLIRQLDHRHEELNYAPLLFAAMPHATKADRKPTITVVEGPAPTPQTFDLPDISRYTTKAIHQRIPSTRKGRATIGPMKNEKLFEETLRKQRGEDLRKRQSTAHPQAIKISNGALTMRQLVEQIDDVSFAERQDAVVTLRLPILVQPGATLIVDGETTTELRLSTDRGALIANAGTLFILKTKVTSWSESAVTSTPFAQEKEFRPFISSYIRSQTYLAGSTFVDLGFNAPTAYGLSMSSHPERERGPAHQQDWPRGEIVDNEFLGLFYGFYSYEARDVAIVGNRYDDNIRYGIDPHDRSTRLIIAKNTAKATRERHGIIGSRGITESAIFKNKSFENAGSGIMLDRQCVGNLIAENQVYRNGQGIAVYESSDNLLTNNTVVFNKSSGIRVRNSTDITAQHNTLVGNGDYGFEIYSKRLDDHDKRLRRGDNYTQRVEVAIHTNTVTGNQGGCIKGNDVHSLSLSEFTLNVDQNTLKPFAEEGKMQLDSRKDQTFGSQLKPHRKKLRRVFDSDHPHVKFDRR